jgi:hypothetical protein
MSYTNISKVQQYLNADLSAIASEVANWITACSKMIDTYIGYSFASSAGDKYYDLREDVNLRFTITLIYSYKAFEKYKILGRVYNYENGEDF